MSCAFTDDEDFNSPTILRKQFIEKEFIQKQFFEGKNNDGNCIFWHL